MRKDDFTQGDGFAREARQSDREEASWSCMQGMTTLDSEFWAEWGHYWGLDGINGNCKDERTGRASDALEEAPGEVGQ